MKINLAKLVGYIRQNIIDLLGLKCAADTPIYLGNSNIQHMQNSHPFDYKIYGDEIPDIIASPDYVSLNKDGSIEYIKEFKIDNNFVKVAVRVTPSGTYYARTIYVINTKRVQDYIAKGTLKKID